MIAAVVGLALGVSGVQPSNAGAGCPQFCVLKGITQGLGGIDPDLRFRASGRWLVATNVGGGIIETHVYDWRLDTSATPTALGFRGFGQIVATHSDGTTTDTRITNVSVNSLSAALTITSLAAENRFVGVMAKVPLTKKVYIGEMTSLRNS